MGNLKVFVLMAGMTALFGVVGQGLGGRQGMVLALAFAGVMNAVAWFGSAKAVLKAYRARIVTPSEAPELHSMIDRLRRRAGLPMPTVAIAPHQQPNAFATGRNPDDAVVCVTRGILDLVGPDELEGVLAHELGHVKNRDMLLQTVSATLAGAVTSLTRFGMYSRREGRSPLGPIAMLLAPVAAMVLQFAVSREREFEADATGAEISGRPLALASALQKLDAAAHRTPMAIPPSVAPLAQVDPLAAYGGGITRLFSTHPATAARVERLRAIAARMGQTA